MGAVCAGGDVKPHGSSAPEIVLEIRSLAAGGEGVGRDAEGRVVFVPFAAPGDRLRVRLIQERPSFARATLVEILDPSPLRRDPPCPVFGRCGGCAWQHLDYAAQVSAKRDILRDALVRIGGLEPPQPLELRASPTPYRTRSRARLLARGGRLGFRRLHSRELCAVRHCPVLVPVLDAALEELSASRPADGEWEIASGDDGGLARQRLGCRLPRGAVSGVRISNGCDWLRVSTGSFFQAHAALRSALAAAVAEAAGSGDACLELFAGSGFFTLLLARRFRRVVAVESSPRALQDLRTNLSEAGRPGVEVRGEAVESALRDPSLRAGGLQVVVLDPPRAGLARGAAAALAGLGAQRIVYLSCDPATLARDLAGLSRSGYRLTHAEGFDLFPQTAHVETLAVLERESPQGSMSPCRSA